MYKRNNILEKKNEFKYKTSLYKEFFKIQDIRINLHKRNDRSLAIKIIMHVYIEYNKCWTLRSKISVISPFNAATIDTIHK